MEAIYGVREEGSCWISLGDPKTGPHLQFDVMGEYDAKLICNTFARVRTLEDALKKLASGNRSPGVLAIAREALAAKDPK